VSSQINCRVAECFPDKSKWCSVEHAYQAVKRRALVKTGYMLYKNLPFIFTFIVFTNVTNELYVSWRTIKVPE